MSDFQRYKNRRKKQNPDFWKDYDERFQSFKLGVSLKQARLDAEMTQEEIARELKTLRPPNL